MKTYNCLIACPVHNEEKYLDQMLSKTLDTLYHIPSHCISKILVIDDGSKDHTAAIIRKYPVLSITHCRNLGYGAALRTAFKFAIDHNFDHIITLDLDGQHPPEYLLTFLNFIDTADVVSGSRYLLTSPRLSKPRAPQINQFFTKVINDLFNLNITDVGCGMKAVSTDLLRNIRLTESGYGMPLEFWCQCYEQHALVRELPIPLIYIPGAPHLAAKFSSLSLFVDYLSYTIFKALLTKNEELVYTEHWPTILAHAILADLHEIHFDLARKFFRHLSRPHNEFVPTLLASKNAEQLLELTRDCRASLGLSRS